MRRGSPTSYEQIVFVVRYFDSVNPQYKLTSLPDETQEDWFERYLKPRLWEAYELHLERNEASLKREIPFELTSEDSELRVDWGKVLMDAMAAIDEHSATLWHGFLGL